MSTQTDFHYQLERAGGLTLDAACAARSAGRLRLPDPHRRLLSSALRKLEGAQQDLFNARQARWSPSPPAQVRQLEL